MQGGVWIQTDPHCCDVDQRVYYDITSHPLWKRLHYIHNLARYDGNVYFLDKTDEVTEWSTGLDFRCYTSSKFEYFLLFFVKFSCSGYGTAVMKIIEITSMTMVQGNYHLKVCLALTFNSGEITNFYQNYEIKLGSFIRINLFKLDRWIAQQHPSLKPFSSSTSLPIFLEPENII